MKSWANGEFTATFTNEMIARNAAATGACSIYEAILNLDADDLTPRNDNE